MSEKFIDQKALDEHEQKPYIIRFIEGPMIAYCEKVTWNVARKIEN
jgi:quinol monooxygenase YgiN